MIQNITQGSNFAGAIKYVHGKDGAERIAGNMSGETPRQLDREWGVYREMNGVVKEDVFHASLSLPPGERLSDEQWQDAAQVYVEKMGFDKSAWVAYRHTDTDHDHIHVIANRIDYDGRAVDMWQSYSRGENICRELEKEHGLTRVEPSRNADLRAPTRGEVEMFKRTGEVSAKIDLQTRVEAASRASETWSQYADELGKQGVGVAISRRESGQPYGISYIRESDGKTMKGSDLGRAYAWQGLQTRAGIDYEHSRDDEAIGRAENRGREAAEQREHRETGTPDHGTTRGGESVEDSKHRDGRGSEPTSGREDQGVDRGDRSVEGGEHRGGRASDGTREPDERADRGDVQRVNASPGRDARDGEPVRGLDETGRADANSSQPEGSTGGRESGRDDEDGRDASRRIVGRRSEQEPDRANSVSTSRDAEGDHRSDTAGTRRVIERAQDAGAQSGSDRGVDLSGNDGRNSGGRELVSGQARDRDPSVEQEPTIRSEARGGTANALRGMDGRGARDVESVEGRQAGASSDIKEQIAAEIRDELDKHRTPEQLKERAEAATHQHNDFHRQQGEREEERRTQSAPSYQLSDDTRRELWKENQIMERIQQGEDLRDSGRMRGEVVDVAQFGDKSAAVVADGKGSFAVVDLDQKDAAGLERGNKVALTQQSGKAAQVKVEGPTAAKDKGHER